MTSFVTPRGYYGEELLDSTKKTGFMALLWSKKTDFTDISYFKIF